MKKELYDMSMRTAHFVLSDRPGYMHASAGIMAMNLTRTEVLR